MIIYLGRFIRKSAKKNKTNKASPPPLPQKNKETRLTRISTQEDQYIIMSQK